MHIAFIQVKDLLLPSKKNANIHKVLVFSFENYLYPIIELSVEITNQKPYVGFY